MKKRIVFFRERLENIFSRRKYQGKYGDFEVRGGPLALEGLEAIRMEMGSTQSCKKVVSGKRVG